MNHGPLKETLNKMKVVFSGYGDKLTVSWYDFETEEGEQFMAKKGIKQHVPLVIWIDDSPMDGRCQEDTVRRFSNRFRSGLFSGEMDRGRPEGRP